MIKRIAVSNDSEERLQEIREAVQKAGGYTVPFAASAQLPPGTVAVVAGAPNWPGAVENALTLACWHEEVLFLLAEALDCREGFVRGSSQRVMEHGTRFALAAGLSRDDQFVLERAALLRGVGKIRVGNEILLKEGLLTYDEWRLIHEYPRFGADILRQAGALSDVADVVCTHRESYDGDGYPDGIEGDAIPYMARMLKIADVYCAMTSPRHYRQGHASHDEAVAYLRGEQGKHFDPELIDVFIDGEVGRPTV